MLIFSVSFQFYRVQPRRVHYTMVAKGTHERTFALSWGDLYTKLLYLATSTK